MIIIQLEEQDRSSKALSILGTDWLVSKTGDKRPDFDRYNPYGKLLSQIQAAKQIKPEVASAVVGIIKEGNFPNWVLDIIKQNDIMLTIQASSESIA